MPPSQALSQREFIAMQFFEGGSDARSRASEQEIVDDPPE